MLYYLLAVTGLLVALGFAVAQWDSNATPDLPRNDASSIIIRLRFLLLPLVSTILILLLSKGYFEKISSHIAEYYAIILLFSLAGIIVMVSFYNLTMLFIGIEIMSVSLVYPGRDT